MDPTKGRVQANLYEAGTGLTEMFYSVRLYLPHDMDTLQYHPGPIEWLTLMEFWNNPNWTGDPYPFRISVELQKPGQGPGPLRFGVYAETGTDNGNWTGLWESFNTEFAVPGGQWITLGITYVEGDNNTGRFLMTATPDGGQLHEVFNLTDFTHHPDDPSPDGLTHFNPFKLYTSAQLIHTMRGMGKLLQVWWDDFELWAGPGPSNPVGQSVGTGHGEARSVHPFDL